MNVDVRQGHATLLRRQKGRWLIQLPPRHIQYKPKTTSPLTKSIVKQRRTADFWDIQIH